MEEDVVVAACVGALGLFGNSLLQLLAIWVLAKRAGGLNLVLPATWARKYRRYFPSLEELCEDSDDNCYSRPLVADRVVLSHPGWRAWALRHPTGQQLAAALQRSAQAVGAVPQRRGSQGHQHQQQRLDMGRNCIETGYMQQAPTSTCKIDATATINPARAAGRVSRPTRPRQCKPEATAPSADALASAGATRRDSEAGVPSNPESDLDCQLIQNWSLAGHSGDTPALSGRQMRAHFPQVCGADINDADPDQLRQRLRGKGLWGWFQFPTNVLRPHQAELTGLLELRHELREQLDEALDAVLDGCSDGGGSGGKHSHNCDGSRSGTLCSVVGPVNGVGGVEGRGAGPSCGGAPPSIEDCMAGAQPAAPDSAAPTRLAARPRLVVLHIRRGDFRPLLQEQQHQPHQPEPPQAARFAKTPPTPPDAAHGGEGPESSTAKPSASGASAVAGAGATATKRHLRDSPPFETDGQQGGAWTDKSGVDFRVPLDWYGDALRALPLDPGGRDVLWVCSDDSQLALSRQVCGYQATSWPAAVAAAAAGAAAAAAEPQAAQAGEPSQLPPAWCRLVSDHAMIADWFVMQRADVLLTSNSTFSFTAAMLSRPRGSGHATTAAEDSTSGPGRALLLRPDPVLAAFRPFDPWGELPLLPSTPVSGNHTVRRQQQQQHLRIQVQLRE